MQALNFNYMTLLEKSESIQGPEFEEIKESIEHYKRLGMNDAVEMAKEGAVAYVLEQYGFRFLFADYRGYLEETLTELYVIKKDGAKVPVTQHDNNFCWHSTALSKYKKPVPIDILKCLPDNAKDKAVILSLEEHKDPILAYPVETIKKYRLKNDHEGTFWRPKTIQRKVELANPYFAGIFAWE